MVNLSERQQQILLAIIQEYVDTAEAVGSENLVDKYEFDFSPATTRNEMVELSKKGFLEKDHVSAGRIPTPLAFRYYVKNLMEERQMPVVNEVAIKQRLWNNRHEMQSVLQQASKALAEELENLSFIVTDKGYMYSAGAAHILRHPEFYDIDLTRTVLYLMDQDDLIRSMLSQMAHDLEFGILLGEELGMDSLKNCGMVVGRIDLPQGERGYIAVLGPYRLNYSRTIPTLRYMQQLVNQLSHSW